jgi:redox-sensitive bicupin YhaK (pirin superfamily)
MRTIQKIHLAESVPFEGLRTSSPLQSPNTSPIDPFILLNHHGPQFYEPNNKGLPFGPHPHRGMETVTFIIDGDLSHKDSTGNDSNIKSGGVQWMTAGSGVIHAEVSSEEFKRKGGNLEILQLWLNLPAKLRMAKPFYKGLQRDDIPSVSEDNEKVLVKIISGEWENMKGVIESISGVSIYTLEMKEGGKLSTKVPVEHNIFFYVVKGEVIVNEQNSSEGDLLEFNHNSEDIFIKCKSDAIILFGHAKPFNETIFAYGPFVMNTREEIQQAYNDYQAGKFGSWV